MSKSREAYHQIVYRTAGEEADEDILEAGADQADEAVELVDPEVVTEPFVENLEDPEVAKSRKSIINSIVERRAKKPSYT